jgi:hypothetical protein
MISQHSSCITATSVAADGPSLTGPAALSQADRRGRPAGGDQVPPAADFQPDQEAVLVPMNLNDRSVGAGLLEPHPGCREIRIETELAGA